MKYLYSKIFPIKTFCSQNKESDVQQRRKSLLKTKVLPLVLLFLIPFVSSAAEFTAAKIGNGANERSTGNWSDAATWGKTVQSGETPTAGVHFPGPGDIAIIKEGFVVTVSETNKTAECTTLRLEPAKTGSSDGAKIVIRGTLQVSTLEQLNTPSWQKIPSLTIATGGHLKISGAFNMEVSASRWVDYTFESGSTVEYNGTGTNQQIESRLTYRNLILSGSGDKSVISSLNVAENLTINNTANFQGGSSSFTHSVGGDWINNSVFTAGNSTINLNGAALQEIKGTSETVFNNLTMSGAGAKKATRNIPALGNLTINSPASFDAGSFTHTVGGNWTNNGTFIPGTSTIILNGSAPQQIGGTVATTFNNLTSSGAQGTALTNNITVKNSLSLSNSNLNTGTGTDLSAYYLINLEPTAVLTGETDNSHIKGRVASQRTVAASGTEFGGIGFNITSNSMSSGEVRVERVTGFTRPGDNSSQSVPRYYEVSHVAGDVTDLNLKMEFSFLNSELGGLTMDSYELVREVIDGDFDNVKSTSSPTRPLVIQNIDKGIFGRYTLSNKLAPLPVDLVWFKAEPKGSEVLLTWQTAWERENKGFEVQLSEDGKVFREVGFVESGSPIKTGAQSYSFLHEENRSTGTRYYRLAQHDLDGKINYSPTRSVEVRNEGLVSAYPNPFTNELTVVLPTEEPCQVILTNHLGKQVYTASTGAAKHSLKLEAPLQDGIYFLTIKTGNNTYSRKLIKH